MKRFTYITIIGFFGLTDNLQASKGPMIKSAAKLTTAAIGTSKILGMPTTHADSQPHYFDTTTTTSSPASSSYKPYSQNSGYQQSNQFNTTKLPSTSPKKLNLAENKTNMPNSGKNKTFAININDFDTSNPAPTETPTISQDVSNQTKNFTLNPNMPNFQNLSGPISPNLGGRFRFSTIKKPQPKPIAGQMLLEYDENYTPEESLTLAENQDADQPAQNKNINASSHQKVAQTVSEIITQEEQPQTKTPVKVPVPTIQKPQSTDKDYDVDEILIDTTVNQTSKKIDTWVHEYADTTSNMYVQQNLHDDIMNTMFSKSSEGKLESPNWQNDIKVIERLLGKYKNNKNVQTTLNGVLTKIKNEMASNVISDYYNPENAANVAAFMGIKPRFDSRTGAVVNIPSIEVIIQAAIDNPSEQAYKALQASLEATNATLNDTSINRNSALTSQLQSLQSALNTTLKKPAFNQFQSWGSYVSSFIPSTQEVLNYPGIKNITLSTAVSGGKAIANAMTPYAKNAASLMNLTSAGDMTLSQAAQKAGLVPADTPAQPIAPKPGSMRANMNALNSDFKAAQQALNFDMSQEDINAIIAKNSSNKAISQSYSPAMKNDIFLLTKRKPQVNSQTGVIENIPTINDIIETAVNNPSQEAFNGLQSALKATKDAMDAYRNEASILGSSARYKQLQAFEKQITSALQDPKFTPYQSWTTQATSYATSLLPSVETVLNTTGLGKVTINQAMNTVSNAPRVANQAISALGLKPASDAIGLLADGAINASGLPNMTLAQAYDYAHPHLQELYFNNFV